MKQFVRTITVALAVMLITALTLLCITAQALTDEVSNNVIFISDNAATDGVEGDGSSADKPLDLYTVGSYKVEPYLNNKGDTTGRNYINCALYQAAEKLVETGGTIVICGPVVIGDAHSYGNSTSNEDVFLPISDQPLRITSVYNGVDYSTTKGAYLGIEAPAHITLGAPSVFENMTIRTLSTSRALCANGKKLVMGEGLKCIGSSTSASGYLTVVGGTRYKGFSGDTDVTIKSGTYNYVGGSNYGISSMANVYNHVGNVSITIEGGTVHNYVCGGAVNSYSTTLDGDVTINIYEGATLKKGVYATSQAQFSTTGNRVRINVYGGSFTDSAAFAGKAMTVNTSGALNANYQASEYILNISDARVTAATSGSTVNKVLNSFVTSANTNGYTDILYPSAWVKGSTVVSAPAVGYAFIGDSVTSEGAKLNLSYINGYDGYTAYTKTVEYSPEDRAFNAVCDTSSTGEKTVDFRYGSVSYYKGSIDVISAPELSILGAQIKTEGEKQGLRFVSQLVNNVKDGTDTAEIKEYGVIAMPADLTVDSSSFDFDHTYGMTVITPDEEGGSVTIGRVTTYYCVIDNIPLNRYNVDHVARAYVKLEYNGETVYRYSEVIRRNPYKIAIEASKTTSKETDEVRAYLAETVVEKKNGYDSTKTYTDTTALRQKVVDYMRGQMELTWTPSESFWINNESSSGVKTNIYFKKGTTYKGIPYTNYSFSQKETFGDLISNGVLDLSKMDGVIPCGNTSSDTTTAYENYKNFPGSDCSTAVITAWNTVLNTKPIHTYLTATRMMVPGNNCGVVAVGDYSYDYETYGNNTFNMTGDSANGAKIYAAYSLLQPGDAIVHYNATNGAGHTRLVVSVDTAAKTVTTIECANWSIPSCTVTSGNGTKVTLTNNNTSWMELTYHFDYLLRDGYVPITVPELVTGHSDSEYTMMTETDLEWTLPEGKLTGKVASNRQILSVDITVSDGTTVQSVSYIPSEVDKATAVHVARMDLSQVDMSGIKLTAGKTYTFDLSVRVVGLTAKHPTVKLVEGYTFTAK